MQHLEITAARIAQDLEVFQTLAEAKSPMTAAELASKKKASPLLVGKWPLDMTRSAYILDMAGLGTNITTKAEFYDI